MITWLCCKRNFNSLTIPQSDLRRWAASRWALPHISSSFFFNARSSRSVGRSPRNFATRLEACSIYKCRFKNLGACPQKNFGREKRAKFGPISDLFQLLARISTFKFDRKYLWNGLSYRQSVNGVINYCPFCVEQRKIDELWSNWSTNHEVVFAYFDLPKIDSAHVFRTTFEFGREYFWNE